MSVIWRQIVVEIANENLKTSHCEWNIPCEYEKEVDFRIIVLVYNRAHSLSKVLSSLQKLYVDGDEACIDIWIDVDSDGHVDENTLKIADSFIWTSGHTNVHVQEKHAGIYGQWIDTWRPKIGSKEIAIILEDDVDLSPFAYRWLKNLHRYYGSRTDVAGYSLYEAEILHMNYEKLPNELILGHKRLGTYAYAPHPARWRQFQDWFHQVIKEKTFRPYVLADPTWTMWYKIFEKTHQDKNMWSIWHIYFTDVNNLITLFSNIAKYMNSINDNFYKGKYLGFHRKEKGLHFHNSRSTPSEEHLIDKWNNEFIEFNKTIPIYDYNGKKLSG